MTVQRFETGPRMSQVVVHGNTVYLAGIVAHNAGGKSMTEQTKDILSTIDRYLAKAGSDIITIHAEAGPHLDRSLQLIRSLGKRAGVSLNPGTPESAIEYVLDRLDLILVMSVNPGFGGQSFIPAVVEKIRRVKALVGSRPIDNEVDGGITPETARQVVEAGANVLVAGSAVFKGGSEQSYRANMDAIRNATRLEV